MFYNFCSSSVTSFPYSLAIISTYCSPPPAKPIVRVLLFVFWYPVCVIIPLTIICNQSNCAETVDIFSNHFLKKKKHLRRGDPVVCLLQNFPSLTVFHHMIFESHCSTMSQINHLRTWLHTSRHFSTGGRKEMWKSCGVSSPSSSSFPFVPVLSFFSRRPSPTDTTYGDRNESGLIAFIDLYVLIGEWDIEHSS